MEPGPCRRATWTTFIDLLLMPDLFAYEQKIYCLIDPITLDVMYIGKSGNPKRRYRHHVSSVINARYKGVKGDWIRYLKEFHNTKPILSVLCYCSQDDVDLWEHYYTKIFSGYPWLTRRRS
jgi:hypothetical protein